MFRSLNSRLLLSYVIVILVCLVLVGLGLLLFVRASPLWARAGIQRLEEAAQATMRTLLQEESPRNLEPERLYELLTQAAEEHEVRILVLDQEGRVQFDTEKEWLGQNLPEVAPKKPPAPVRWQGTFAAPDGQRWNYLGEMVPGVGGRRRAVVFVSRPTRLLLLIWFADNLLLPLVRAGVVALLLSVLLALLTSRSVSRPLRKVADAARSIARGESGTRAPVSGPAEVQGLARSFNTMAAQVEATQASQRDFVANVSHELKTPLTSIQGFSQALLDGTASTPEATAHAARVINEEAERMRRMVDELLILARFDAGQMVMARDPVEVGPLLHGCVEKLAPQAQAADVALELNVPERLFVTGDVDRLAQVFANLLDNGLAHTPAGGRVTVAAHQAEGADALEVTVTDTGEGIPPEALPRVFERFYQVDKARRHSRGAGLGLAISKEIVEAHGGTVVVESVVGLGSKFTVRLPARVRLPAQDGDTAAAVTDQSPAK